MEALDWQAWLTAATILVLIVALVKEVWRPDLVLMGTLCWLLLVGVLPPEEAFSGFSNSAILSIVFLFVVAAGMQRTEALVRLDRLLFSRAPSLPRRLARMMSTTALASGFVNNTPLVAVLIPRFQQWAREHGVAASKLLMPLSYAAVLGGMITLIGTSTNLIVAGLLEAATDQRLSFFDLTWVGLPAAAAGIAYFVLYGYRLLPDHADTLSPLAGREPRYHCELRIGAASPIVGKALGELRGADGILYPSTIRRGNGRVEPAAHDTVLHAGDVLSLVAEADAIQILRAQPGLEGTISGASDGQAPTALFEAVLSGASGLVGETLDAANFHDRFQANVLAIQRQDEHLAGPLGDLPLAAGDLLLLEAPTDFYERWNANREEFYLVAPYLSSRPVERREKAPIALLIFGAMVVLTATGVLPLVTAAFAAAVVMLLTGCLHIDEARRSIDLPVLLMIGAAFGISRAIEQTGLAAFVAGGVLDVTQGLGPLAVLIGLYLITTVMTELLTNAAAAALVFPVAVTVARDMGVDVMPFALAVAVAASAGFATPFGYQTNLMVMGPGGYTFMDFVRAGVPLNLIVMAVAVLVIWLKWL